VLASDIKHDDVRTRIGPLRERRAALDALFAEMADAARRQLELEGFVASDQRLVRSLDLRYRGQAFELNVAVGHDGAPLPETDALEATFHRQHAATYGHADPTAAVELVNARLVAYGVVPKPAAEPYRSATRDMEAALRERRAVWFDGKRGTSPVWDRDHLPERAIIEGPAIVEEFGATTVVPPGWRGALDEHGNLRLARVGDGAHDHARSREGGR
jgi:N-methylhydantoinase A